MFTSIIAQMNPSAWSELVTDPLTYISAQALRVLPLILGALILLLLFWLLAVIFRAVTRKVVDLIRLDRLLEGTRLAGYVRSISDNVTLASLLGTVVYWAILMSGFAAAADVLEIHAVRDIVHAVVAFLPHIISAVLALAVGAAIASAVARAVGGLAGEAKSPYASMLEKMTEFVLMLVVVTVTLDLLGADLAILSANVTILLGAAILAIAFLVAWGMRRPAEHVIANFYLRRLLVPGDRVAEGSISGTVERFAPLGFVLRTDEGQRRLVLAREFLEQAVWQPKE